MHRPLQNTPATEPVIVVSENKLRAIISDEVSLAVEEAVAKQERRVDQQKAWLSNAEAMAYLGVSRSTLARYRKGTLLYSKLGANVYYRREDIEKALESRLQRGAE